MEEFYCLSCGHVATTGLECPICHGTELIPVPDEEYEDWLDDLGVNVGPDLDEEWISHFARNTEEDE